MVGTCEHWVDKCYTAARRTMDANTISIFGRGSEQKGIPAFCMYCKTFKPGCSRRRLNPLKTPYIKRKTKNKTLKSSTSRQGYKKKKNIVTKLECLAYISFFRLTNTIRSEFVLFVVFFRTPGGLATMLLKLTRFLIRKKKY